MVAPCCCGISLMRGTQYVAIADVVLAILNISAITAHLDYTDEPHNLRLKSSYYSNIQWIPQWLAIAVLVCHIMQFFREVAARSKNRTGCFVWMCLNAPTILFTWVWVLLRLYELAVVYEYTEELKQEHEVSYFPGYNGGQQQHHDQIVPRTMLQNQHMALPPPMENNGVGIYPTFEQMPMPTQNHAYYELYNHQNYVPQPPPPPFQQPPPQYDTIVMEHNQNQPPPPPFFQVSGAGVGGAGNNFGKPDPMTPFMFPRDKNAF
ncbi:unnamed protein product [Orchesella dallaii]|uniref:Transmembrane protein n=1 Tax=Orchesella dallaii TaxID=48710 RepID=A0ABP1QCH5_9HEXA